MTHVLKKFDPTASATAEGRSLSGPNNWLRPKVKIAPTVQHWILQKRTRQRQQQCRGGAGSCLPTMYDGGPGIDVE